LIAAPADQRPRLKKPPNFSARKTSRDFFRFSCTPTTILRRKPDARLHLEMGLLRMVNAARLRRSKKFSAELEGGTPVISPRDAIQRAPQRTAYRERKRSRTAVCGASERFAKRPAVRANVPSAFSPQHRRALRTPRRPQACAQRYRLKAKIKLRPRRRK
jgi:hypothetical protein